MESLSSTTFLLDLDNGRYVTIILISVLYDGGQLLKFNNIECTVSTFKFRNVPFNCVNLMHLSYASLGCRGGR